MSSPSSSAVRRLFPPSFCKGLLFFRFDRPIFLCQRPLLSPANTSTFPVAPEMALVSLATGVTSVPGPSSRQQQAAIMAHHTANFPWPVLPTAKRWANEDGTNPCSNTSSTLTCRFPTHNFSVSDKSAQKAQSFHPLKQTIWQPIWQPSSLHDSSASYWTSKKDLLRDLSKMPEAITR